MTGLSLVNITQGKRLQETFCRMSLCLWFGVCVHGHQEDGAVLAIASSCDHETRNKAVLHTKEGREKGRRAGEGHGKEKKVIT